MDRNFNTLPPYQQQFNKTEFPHQLSSSYNPTPSSTQLHSVYSEDPFYTQQQPIYSSYYNQDSQQRHSNQSSTVPNVIAISPKSELQLFIDPYSSVSIRLLHSLSSENPNSNDAEIWGFQIPVNATYTIPSPYNSTVIASSVDGNVLRDKYWPVSVWSWNGCQLDVKGNILRYVVSSNQQIEKAFNIHNIFQTKRVESFHYLISKDFKFHLLDLIRQCQSTANDRNNILPDSPSAPSLFWSFMQNYVFGNKSPIPRVLVVGPSIKNPSTSHEFSESIPSQSHLEASQTRLALCHSLCGWARSFSYPIYIELDHSVSTFSPIEVLSFPPSVIGAIQVSDMTALGYKTRNYYPLGGGGQATTGKNDSYVLSTVLPSLCTESKMKTLPSSIGRLCYHLQDPDLSTQTKRNGTLFHHQLQSLKSSLILSVIHNLYELGKNKVFKNPRLSQFSSKDVPIQLHYLSSGWIINSPNNISSLQSVEKLIEFFYINNVIVIENPELYNQLLSRYPPSCQQLHAENIASQPLTQSLSIFPSQFLYSSHVVTSDPSTLLKIGWIDHFFGRQGPHISQCLKSPPSSSKIVTYPYHPLQCQVIKIPLQEMRIVTLTVENEIEHENKHDFTNGDVEDNIMAECTLFNGHPTALLNHVLGIVSVFQLITGGLDLCTGDVECSPLLGFAYVKSIESTSNHLEEPNLTVMVELVLCGVHVLHLNSKEFFKSVNFLLNNASIELTDLREITG